jgi:hypothetical protein
MKRFITAIIFVCTYQFSAAQFVQFSPTGDTSESRVTLEGYVDAYFAFDGMEPGDGNRSYFVSQSRHNEFNINMAYISIKFNSERVRATFTPGFGTYMNANYATERMTLKNIIEANVGVRLLKSKNIWLDVGVIPSPYTNETAISYDQLTYSRSFAPEYVPYYLSGARLSVPVTGKFTAYLYLLNGWQMIEDVNMPLALGTQFEYKPTDKVSLYLNTYFGDERSATAPMNRKRYFADFYMLYNPGKKWNIAFSTYAGSQIRVDPVTEKKSANNWWQANVAARYFLDGRNSLSARAEYFHDPKEVMIAPVTNAEGFSASSFSLGYNLAITRNVLFRVEGRYFHATKNLFGNNEGSAKKDNQLLISGLTIKF